MEFRWIHGLCGEVFDNKVYIYSIDHNAIYMFDVKNKCVRIYKGRESAGLETKNSGQRSLRYKDEFIFLPLHTGSIVFFSPRKGESRELFVKKPEWLYEPVVYNDKLYLLSISSMEEIVCVDMRTEKINYLPTKINVGFDIKLRSSSECLYLGECRIGSEIFRACTWAPYVICCELHTGRCRVVRVNGVEELFRVMAYDGKYFWFCFQNSSRVIQWDADKNKIVYQIDLKKYYDSEEAYVASIQYGNGKIYAIPYGSTCMVAIDVHCGSAEYIDCRDIPSFVLNGKQPFADYVKTDDSGNVYFIPFQANGILVMRENQISCFYETKVSCEDITKSLGTSACTNESMESLDIFIDRVESGFSSDRGERETVGSCIWREIGRHTLKKM